MKKCLFLAACLFLVTGCEKEENGPAPQQMYLAYLTGAEVKPVKSTPATAEGVYDPEASYLKLRLKLDRIRPTSWQIYRVDPGETGDGQLVFDLGTSLGKLHEIQINLTEAQEKDLKEGRYVVAVRSEELPDEVLRGQLLASR